MNGEHREEVPRGLVRFLWVSAAVAAVLLVVNLAEGDPLDQAFRALWLGGAVLPLLLLRRSRTVIADEGVTTTHGVFRPRLVTWQEVAAVRVGTRYDPESFLVLHHGRDVRLRGVPRDVAALVAEAHGWEGGGPVAPPRTAAAPSSGRSGTGGPRPDDDLDLEGPFRRGPRRR